MKIQNVTLMFCGLVLNNQTRMMSVMKKIICLLSIIGLLLVPMSSFATNVWKTGTTIQGLQVLPDGGFILYLPVGTDGVCPEGRLMYVAVNQNSITQEGLKTTLSVAMLAYSTGNLVSIVYDNAANSKCYVQQLYLSNAKG